MRWSGNQIPLTPKFITDKGRYGLLSRAALDYSSLTLNCDFIKNEFFDGYQVCRSTRFPTETVFKEIVIGEPGLNEAERQYCYDPNGWNKPHQPVTTALEKVLVRDWDPDKTHVFLHSAGYDSRLISYVLAKLRDEMGAGWIGNLIFLCWEPEAEVFKEIMQYEGWSPRYFHVYKEKCQNDFRAELIEFSQVWKWANSYYLPWYVAGPAIEELMRLNRIPSNNICLLSAMWGNEVPMRNNFLRTSPTALIGKTYPNFQVDSLFNEFYYLHEMGTANAALLSYGEFKLPYSDVDVAPYVTNNEEDCRQISAEFHGLTFREALHPYFFYLKDNNLIWLKTDKRLSESTRRRAASNLNNSWYAREMGFPELGLEISPEFNINPKWWRDYVLASTCEHLISQGVKIRCR